MQTTARRRHKFKDSGPGGGAHYLDSDLGKEEITPAGAQLGQRMSVHKGDGGGPAFPVVHTIQSHPGDFTYAPPAQEGMTLRDYFAAQALIGMQLAAVMMVATGGGTDDVKVTAEGAYEMADAMLAERDK